jgi:eukaryotic-like serine/threonine-protein kinase
MSSSGWKRIEDIFHQALDRPPDEREAFLRDACRDDSELGREVASLLAQVGKDEDFMDRSAMDVEAEAIAEQPSGRLSGRVIAHYHIASLVGHGGMAEVYRAHDTHLDRDVAVKVLLGSSSLNAESLARFQREAKLLASVTHPNVASVYGFERADDLWALIMELIEGETLADRIQRKPLEIDEALRIAADIAAALEAAHARDIIHRDLKPSNVRIASDGTVKVLDFGLAKILQQTNQPDERRQTFFTQGLPILGTVAYMSPEQARGRMVDKRTDVWAWGCVLYEMLTGRRAFEGSTWTDTIARIAGENPDWEKLPISTPAAVRNLLKDCLEKDPERRLRDIAEVRRRILRPSTVGMDSAPGSDIALSSRAARFLFLFIQFGYLAMYCVTLYYVDALDIVTLPVVTVAAMSGIAVRLYLISGVALVHPDAGQKFRKLFPVLLALDGAWAASPLLAIRTIGSGLALAAVAGLAYLPFSQRTLINRMYGRL